MLYIRKINLATLNNQNHVVLTVYFLQTWLVSIDAILMLWRYVMIFSTTCNTYVSCGFSKLLLWNHILIHFISLLLMELNTLCCQQLNMAFFGLNSILVGVYITCYWVKHIDTYWHTFSLSHTNRKQISPIRRMFWAAWASYM